jgi:hypothetical protein
MSIATSTISLQESAPDLTRRAVYVKVHLGFFGNTRKVNNALVDVDADKALVRVSKTLLDSQELKAIKTLDGEIRQYLYSMCLPFEPGVLLLPLQLIETVDRRLREFEGSRRSLVVSFVDAYPELCKQAAERLRGIYNPLDYPSVETAVSKFTFNWQYVSFGVPDQLREISSRIFQTERDKAAQMMAEASREVQQVLRAALAELVENLSDRLKDESGGKPRRLRESTVQKLRDFMDTFDFRNVTDDVELREQVEKARELLSGVNTDAIRNTATLRSKIKDGMSEIAATLETMVANGLRRKFCFDDD